ncbi:hypothetical protein RSP799_08395, partial [Ralstonia solanacearum]
GALVAGLGGGSAIGGAVGAGAASFAAPKLTKLADEVSSSVGGGDAGQMVGNVVANVAAGAVGSVGGGSGAFMGANVDRYNRQLHEKETTVIRNKARQLAATGTISYDDAVARLSSQALRDVDAEYAAAHPGVDMQAQAWLNQLKGENPEGFNHMPLFQATRDEYRDSTLYAGTKLTNPDIYAAANRPPIQGTISPNRVNLMPLVTGNAKSLANTGIEVLNKGMAIVSGPFGPDVSMPLIPMTEEESAAATATAIMAAPLGVRGRVGAADAGTTTPIRNYAGGGASLADDSEFLLGERQLPRAQGSLSGEAEAPPRNARPDQVRAVGRQNEAAKILADHGLDVEQLPNTGKSVANPDLKINGQVADVYSPTSGNLQTIRDTVVAKVGTQAPNVVINLADSPLNSSQVAAFLQRNPVPGMNNVVVIKNGVVTVIRK